MDFIYFLCWCMFFTLLSPAVAARDRAKIAEQCAQKMLNVQIKEKDWFRNSEINKTIQDAFKACLAGMIQIKTISPQGNEEQMVEFLEILFTNLDIPHKRFSVENLTGQGTRTNFLATLAHDFTENSSYDWKLKPNVKSIILLNHMDVVSANPEQWENADYAFSGKIAPSRSEPNRDFIWGRGALDMKGVAMTQIMNLWLLKQLRIPLKRDIHFLAVADEEKSGSGAIGTLRKMQKGRELYALSEASMVLNEGGGGIQEAPRAGWELFLVAVEEKGGAWLEFSETEPLELLRSLYQLKVLDINNFISKKEKKFTGHGCEILEIDTPSPKVNVVASKITASFKCKEGLELKALFENVFKQKFPRVKAFASQSANRVHLTVETESSSHGSTGINDSAILALVLGLYQLDLFDVKKNESIPDYFRSLKTEATESLLKTLGESDLLIRVVHSLSFIPMIRNLLLSSVEGTFGVDGLFRTSCQLTALSSQKGRSNALVDCRLLHTAMKKENRNQAQSFVQELEKEAENKNLKIKLLDGWDVSQSPINTADYKMMAKTLESYSTQGKSGKKVRVVPYLFPAGSDSTWFRNPYSAGVPGLAAIPSYGFFPIFLNAELLATFHGSNERFPVDQILGTVERYHSVLLQLAINEGVSNSRGKKSHQQKKLAH